MLTHLRLLVRAKAPALSDRLHDLEGVLRLHAPRNKIQHDIIACADSRAQRTVAVFDEILSVIQPYICTVRQTGNTDELGQSLRLRIPEHAHDKAGPEFRNAKRSEVDITEVSLLKPQSFYA